MVPTVGEDFTVSYKPVTYTEEELREMQELADERWAEIKRMPYETTTLEEFEAEMAEIWARVNRRRNRKSQSPARMAAAAHA